MTNSWTRLQTWLVARVWDVDLRGLPARRRIVLRTLRLLYVELRELLSGDLTLRAMSLVYTTLLALVPLLAVSFSVLKAFGVHNQIEPLLYNFLAPLGPKGNEVAARIVEFVENMKVGVLGSIGLAMLLYTVVSLMQKIEGAFNFVWRIERSRSLSQRFSSYLSVVLIGPVMVFSALGITATVMQHSLVQQLLAVQPLGTLVLWGSKLVPYLLVCAAFTFVYVFIPNTRVRFGPAAMGGLIAGVLWETTGWGFAAFIASSSRYAAIYSSFAILILLLIWLYLSWLILLLGSQIAFFMQHPQYLTMHRVRLVLSNRMREKLALLIMYLVAYHHHHNRAPWTLSTLAARLDLPSEPVDRVISMLEGAGYLRATADEEPAYLPARDIETIGLAELLADVRRADESRFLRDERMPVVDPVQKVFADLQGAAGDALRGRNLKGLVLAAKEPE